MAQEAELVFHLSEVWWSCGGSSKKCPKEEYSNPALFLMALSSMCKCVCECL